MTLEEIKRNAYKNALVASGWNKSKAGKMLNVSHVSVYQACRKYGWDPTPPQSVVKQWGLRTRGGGSTLTITAEHGSNIEVRATNGEVFSIGRQTLRHMLECGDLVLVPLEVPPCKPSN